MATPLLLRSCYPMLRLVYSMLRPLLDVTPVTRCYARYSMLRPLLDVTPFTRCYARYSMLRPLLDVTPVTRCYELRTFSPQVPRLLWKYAYVPSPAVSA